MYQSCICGETEYQSGICGEKPECESVLYVQRNI